MQKPDPLLDEIEIRQKIYEETKDMTVEERGTYFNRCGEEMAKEYGFKVVSCASETDEMHEMYRKIDEEIKDMTGPEVAEYFNRRAEAIAKKHVAKLMSTDTEVIENAKT